VLPLFDRVLVDIGDEQSIAADLSTFSAHMLNLKAMLAEATPKSLVLVDEMVRAPRGRGGGTGRGAARRVFARRIASCWRPRTMTVERRTLRRHRGS